jgi:hypothetical protein
MGKVINLVGRESPQLKINANNLIDLTCDECNGKIFRLVQMFKRVPALISQTGKEQIVPIQIFRCDDCGHINAEFLPNLDPNG